MSETPRRSDGKRKFLHDYISDLDLFKAVSFARSMIRSGTDPAHANWQAAKYYGVKTADVAHYTGQVAGTSVGRRRKRN
jgi:hypothetical protein